jgi:hypothetical protein
LQITTSSPRQTSPPQLTPNPICPQIIFKPHHREQPYLFSASTNSKPPSPSLLSPQPSQTTCNHQFNSSAAIAQPQASIQITKQSRNQAQQQVWAFIDERRCPATPLPSIQLTTAVIFTPAIHHHHRTAAIPVSLATPQSPEPLPVPHHRRFHLL